MLRRSIRNSSQIATMTSQRPLPPLRMPTTTHCIPREPFLDVAPKSAVPSLSYSSSSEGDEPEVPQKRRASTMLISQNAADVQRIIGEPGTQLVEKCCGGGCMMSLSSPAVANKKHQSFGKSVPLPDNEAFRAFKLNISDIPETLTGIADLPPKTVTLSSAKNAAAKKSPSPSDSGISLTYAGDETTDFTPQMQKSSHPVDTTIHPPSFVQPHPPYDVYSAKIFNVRELTKPGAEKRTYHFDLDVTDYPSEGGVDFKVGGAIGIMAPNESVKVDELLDLLAVPRFLRDRAVLLRTSSGRWPTVWGDEKPRELHTTRRDLLTWCSDVQSYAPTKPLVRLFAEHATDAAEKKLLTYLVSAEGQGAFCELRTGPHVSLNQLLHAFPSSRPPLDHLLSVLQPLMPRFYSLSNDPHENCVPVEGCHRLVEIAVSVHETPNWRGGPRTGVGSGFFERQARRFLAAEAAGTLGEETDLRVPMFKGLMANPLAREFVADGPMLLIGAGVGVAPFRGFVQRRLKSANCANKVWVLQGVRDSLLDELYSGEWGVHESEVKKVVQSRSSSGEGRYVQEEVRAQADLVWWIINALDGRVFVCGSSKGMGEGVEEALVDVAKTRGNLSERDAREFWALKKEGGAYIAETW